MTRDQLQTIVGPHQAACLRDYGMDCRCWVVLVTGPDEALLEFALDTPIDWLDSRGETARGRLFYGDGDHDVEPVDPIAALLPAVLAAEARGVTLQLLCAHGEDEATRERHDLGGGAAVTVSAMHETYPVVYLAPHGKQWEPAKK